MRLIDKFLVLLVMISLAGCSPLSRQEPELKTSGTVESSGVSENKATLVNTPVVTTTPGSKISSASSGNEFVFNFSDKELLTDENIKHIDNNLRMLARNEIYARHGYVFSDQYLKNYFSKCSWYAPTPGFMEDYSQLNAIEKSNVEFIKKFEDEKNDEYGEKSFAYMSNKECRASARFDLDSDGKPDDIVYEMNSHSNGVESFKLKVNNTALEGTGDNISEKFAITCMTGKKGLYEIVIFQDGPSDDPDYNFYYYDGKSINKMGTCYGYEMKPDRYGKVYTSYSYFWNLEMLSGEKIPLSWYEFSDDRKIQFMLNKDKLIGQKAKITGQNVYNENGDTGIHIFPKSRTSPYGSDFTANVKKGDIVTILDIDNLSGNSGLSREAAIKVSTEDGKVGWMVHMFGGD